MKRNKNTPGHWDNYWASSAPTPEQDAARLRKVENGILWRRIEGRMLSIFGSFSGLSVVEIGAGAGTYSALMAKRGARVSLLDYSEAAIERARSFFDRHALSAQFIKRDVLSLPAELSRAYDVAMSFGLAEHFKGRDRALVVKAHFDIVKDGGVALICVPNSHNLPYRLLKALCELKGIWYFGEEYPYSRRELQAICGELGINSFSFLGSSFPASFALINPFWVSRHLNRFRLRGAGSSRAARKQRGTFLDEYFGHELALCARRQAAPPGALRIG